MFRFHGRPSSRPRGVAAVLGLAGLLTLAACATDSGTAAPVVTTSVSTPPPVSTPAPVSTPPVSTSATVSPISSAATASAPPGQTTAVSVASSRSADVQAVTAWWVATVKSKLNRTADPVCVSGVVAQLGDPDLALMAAAAKSGAGAPPALSAAGNAVGGGLAACLVTGGAPSGQGTSTSSRPAPASQVSGAAAQCWLTTAELSGLFQMDFKEPTHRVHIGTLGTANGCKFESTTSASHTVAIVLYDKIDPAEVKSYESEGRTIKPVPNLGDAAYYSGNSLDIVIGTRMISIDQEPFGDEDGIFATGRLLLTRLK